MSTITPLRKRMIEDTATAQSCASPEHLNLEDICQYQVYLNDCGYSAESVNQFVSAVKFLYGVTLEAPFDTGALLRARVPSKAPIILSQQEVAAFSTKSPAFAAAPRDPPICPIWNSRSRRWARQTTKARIRVPLDSEVEPLLDSHGGTVLVGGRRNLHGPVRLQQADVLSTLFQRGWRRRPESRAEKQEDICGRVGP